MLDSLQDYYRAQGISAEGFNCPRQASCRSVCRDFVTAREPYVGRGYEQGTLPRVLFVSLDASSDHPGRLPAQRTLAAGRAWEEAHDPNLLPKGRHWYRTIEFAHCLLAPTAMARGITPFTLRDAHRCFAHTNSAKCKDAARGTNQGLARLFENCRPFIAPEVEVFAADVLVTQGGWAHRAAEDAFVVERTLAWTTQPQYTCTILRVGDRPLLHFKQYHPRAFGPFNRHRREAYGWYAVVATAFFARGSAAAARVCAWAEDSG